MKDLDGGATLLRCARILGLTLREFAGKIL